MINRKRDEDQIKVYLFFSQLSSLTLMSIYSWWEWKMRKWKEMNDRSSTMIARRMTSISCLSSRYHQCWLDLHKWEMMVGFSNDGCREAIKRRSSTGDVPKCSAQCKWCWSLLCWCDAISHYLLLSSDHHWLFHQSLIFIEWWLWPAGRHCCNAKCWSFSRIFGGLSVDQWMLSMSLLNQTKPKQPTSESMNEWMKRAAWKCWFGFFCAWPQPATALLSQQQSHKSLTLSCGGRLPNNCHDCLCCCWWYSSLMISDAPNCQSVNSWLVWWYLGWWVDEYRPVWCLLVIDCQLRVRLIGLSSHCHWCNEPLQSHIADLGWLIDG